MLEGIRTRRTETKGNYSSQPDRKTAQTTLVAVVAAHPDSFQLAVSSRITTSREGNEVEVGSENRCSAPRRVHVHEPKLRSTHHRSEQLNAAAGGATTTGGARPRYAGTRYGGIFHCPSTQKASKGTVRARRQAASQPGRGGPPRPVHQPGGLTT